MAANSSISNFDGMKRFLIKLMLFLSVLGACDYSIGYALNHLYNRTFSGSVGIVNSILRQRSEMVIMGSSRAKYHYDPAALSEAGNRSVYNAGMEGQGALFQYGLLHLILDKYRPKTVLLNIDPADLKIGEDSYDKLSVLLPHRENKTVGELISRRGRFEPLKSASKIYPYNSLVLSLVASQFLSEYRVTPDGYEPVNGSLTEEKTKTIRPGKTTPVDPHFSQWVENGIGLLDSICELTRKNDIQLIVGISPAWVQDADGGRDAGIERADEDKSYALLKSYFSKNGIPIVQITQDIDPEFVDYSLFKDTYHLNKKGASIFSKKVAASLKPLLKPVFMDSTAHISTLTETFEAKRHR